jgi:hypothetical protein
MVVLSHWTLYARLASGGQPISIIDRREIEFDGNALISVIAGSLQRAQAIGLPPLRPISIGFSPRSREISVEYETHAVAVASDRLGALLVAYCVRARIPISRRADKDIRIGAGSVFLTFATHFSDVPATW